MVKVKNPILVEEFLDGLSKFYQKTLHVNSLYDNLVKSTTTNNGKRGQRSNRWKENEEGAFNTAWRELISEKVNFFDSEDIMSSNKSVAVAQSIIASINFDDRISKIDVTDIIDGIKFTPAEKHLSKSIVYYSVEDNQDDTEKNSSFPHFGVSIILALSFNEEIFQIVIARSKDGCNNLLVPKFDTKNLKIHGRKKEIKFQSPQAFQAVLNFADETILAINEYLEKAGVEKLVRHFEICNESVKS